MAGGGFGAPFGQRRAASIARMGGRGVAGGHPGPAVWWVLRSRGIDIRNFLFFMASLPFLSGFFQASASALTGDGWLPRYCLWACRAPVARKLQNTIRETTDVARNTVRRFVVRW